MAIFQMLTDEILIDIVKNANQRVVYIAPGIWHSVANAILEYKNHNSTSALEIILDPDPQVCRLGYGELAAIKSLNNEGIYLRKCLGIRVGLLIADDEAWFFTPTPRLIEKEPSSSTKFAPNSVAISLEQAKQLLSAIEPQLVISDMLEQKTLADKPPIFGVPKPEIAHEVFSIEDIEVIDTDLEKCPPQQFDLARQVNVYSSYIQFVELSLEGTHLTRHTISIPQELLNLASDKKDKDRLKATYQLIRSDSNISGKAVNVGMKALRDKYMKSLGSYGTVILKQHKNDFIEDLKQLQAELDKFKKEVESELEKEFKACSENLKGILGPIIKENPPDELRYGIYTPTPNGSQVDMYLDDKLAIIIPEAKHYIEDMVIHYQFKEVTYETLHNNDFIKKLHNAFPYAGLPDVPIDECTAAPVKNKDYRLV